MGEKLFHKRIKFSRINGDIVIEPTNIWIKKIEENTLEEIINEGKQIKKLLGKNKISHYSCIKEGILKIDVGEEDYKNAQEIINNYYKNQQYF